MRGPCLECKERHVGCHGSCERYKEFREKLDRIKRARKQYEATEYDQTARLIRLHFKKLKREQ